MTQEPVNDPDPTHQSAPLCNVAALLSGLSAAALSKGLILLLGAATSRPEHSPCPQDYCSGKISAK